MSGAMMKVACECCGTEFQTRVSDRERGWGRFCSKSCKARGPAPPQQEEETFAMDTGPHPDPLDWRQNIEAPADALFSRSAIHTQLQPEQAATVSIAISLKRIADALDRVTEGSADRWHHAITDIAYSAGESFERGKARGR